MPFTLPTVANTTIEAHTDQAAERPILTLARCQARMEPALSHQNAFCINRELAQENLSLRKMEPDALDATLHKLVFDDLRRKGILLLKTPRSCHSTLSADWIRQWLENTGKIPVTSNISIQNGKIASASSQSCCPITHGLRYLVQPMRFETEGYGLLIIDFINKAPQTDHFHAKYMAAGAYCFIMHHDQRRETSTTIKIEQYLRNIPMPMDSLKIKYLQQDKPKHTAEYLIALLQEIAAPEHDLTQLADLDILDHAICEETIPEYVQLSQIRLFGPMYYGVMQNNIFKNITWQTIYDHLKDLFLETDPSLLIDCSMDLSPPTLPPGSPVICASTKRSTLTVFTTAESGAPLPGKSFEQTLSALQQLSLLRKKAEQPENTAAYDGINTENFQENARSEFM